MVSKRLHIAASLLLAALVTLPSCRATDEVRRGDLNEFCNNRDEDCRAGLVCEEGICVEAHSDLEYTCSEMCERLAECDAADPNCALDCRITVQDWSVRAIDDFGVCMVEELTCEEARAGDPPQLCYEQIEIPAGREDRCQSFLETALECDPNATTDKLRGACYRLARVGSGGQWSATERCVDATETGICSGIATCFNDEFELDPPIRLGEATL